MTDWAAFWSEPWVRKDPVTMEPVYPYEGTRGVAYGGGENSAWRQMIFTRQEPDNGKG